MGEFFNGLEEITAARPGHDKQMQSAN